MSRPLTDGQRQLLQQIEAGELREVPSKGKWSRCWKSLAAYVTVIDGKPALLPAGTLKLHHVQTRTPHQEQLARIAEIRRVEKDAAEYGYIQGEYAALSHIAHYLGLPADFVLGTDEDDPRELRALRDAIEARIDELRAPRKQLDLFDG